MTPEALSRINDLRSRVLQADEALRAGDHDRAQRLMPSDDEIIEALKLARSSRAEAVAAKSAKSEAKAKIASMTLDDLFGD
jgi:hypothetical protein